MFVLALTNHLALGAFQSRTLSHFFDQWSSPAIFDQNVSGESMDSRYIVSYCSRDLMWALAEKAWGGGNRRFSWRVDSIPVDWGWDMVFSLPLALAAHRAAG